MGRQPAGGVSPRPAGRLDQLALYWTETMRLSRRGFIEAVTALAAAASGGSLPSGRSASRPTQEQFDLTEALKQCRVTGYEWHEFIDLPSQLTVKYEYAPNASTSILDEAVAQWINDGLLPVAVTMTCEESVIDVSMIGAPIMRPALSIEVTYY